MKTLYGGFFPPTSESEIEEVWQQADLVFDTCAILDLYRSPAQLRRDLLQALVDLQSRLWIPYQVGYEFTKNRTEVIKEQRELFDIAKRTFTEKVTKAVRDQLKQLRIVDTDEIEEISKLFNKPIKQAAAVLVGFNDRLVHDISTDPIFKELDTILGPRIGSRPTKDELESRVRQAAVRYDFHLPPGRKDAKAKDGENKYGDVLVWFEMLDRAGQVHRPVIFVTSETKTDWWCKIPGEKDGPWPYLRQEMWEHARVHLIFVSISDFLQGGQKYLGLQVTPKAIQEAEDLQQEQASRNLPDVESPQLYPVFSYALPDGLIEHWRSLKLIPGVGGNFGMTGLPPLTLTAIIPAAYEGFHFSEEEPKIIISERQANEETDNP